MSREDRKRASKGLNANAKSSHHSLTSDSSWICQCDECQELMTLSSKTPSRHSNRKDEKPSSDLRGHSASIQSTTDDNYENINDWPSARISVQSEAESLANAFKPVTPLSIGHLEDGLDKRSDDSDSTFDVQTVRRKHHRKDKSKNKKLKEDKSEEVCCRHGKQCELAVKTSVSQMQQPKEFTFGEYEDYENIGISPKDLPPPSSRSSKDANGKSVGVRPKQSSEVTISSETFYENMSASSVPSKQLLNRQVEKESALMAQRGYDNVYPIAKDLLEPEFPPSRTQSLRLNSAPKSSLQSEALKKLLEGSTITAVAPMSSELSKANEAENCTTVCDFLKLLPDLTLPNLKFGKVETLIAAQVITALILVVLSLTLSVTGSTISSAMLSGAILIIVQLLPSIGCLLFESPHVSFVFRLSTQICAYFNSLWSVVYWMMVSESRVFLLLAIATLQYGCLCALNYYDYQERNERRLERKLRGKNKVGK